MTVEIPFTSNEGVEVAPTELSEQEKKDIEEDKGKVIEHKIHFMVNFYNDSNFKYTMVEFKKNEDYSFFEFELKNFVNFLSRKLEES
mmetsp:Transcript_1185/g.1137  ORF Transcript_1185/g.1137 Transcript_1185/m.1137 type:complete len:87 (+) Transcript_1185:1-261(+)